MAEQGHGRGGGWFTTHLHGVTDHLGAISLAAIVAFVARLALEPVWQRVFHQLLPEWTLSLLAYLVSVIALLCIWVVSRLIWRMATRRARQTPRARGDRLSIYVAKFGDDKLSADARARVIRSISAELGPARVEVLPAGIQLSLTEGVSDDSAEEDARKKARSLLRKKHGDLLIWGMVYAFDSAHPQLDLRFVSAEADRSRAEPFGFTDKLMLEPDFGVEMGAALAAVAAALAATVVRDAGQHLVQTLMPVAERLALLVRNIPASLSANDRARLLRAFGLIQSEIGGQSGDSVQLEEAVAAYRQALEVWTRERAPLDWAKTQNSIGNALAKLGEREARTERLQEAVSAYREALEVWTRDQEPLKWATAQNNLGNALSSLGRRESGTERLEQAVAAYREALQERTRERVPLDWAATQNNLGNALQSLGERESGTKRLEEAVLASRQALREWARKRVPLSWAAAQINLGTALARLGEREKGTRRLREAVAAYREALREYSRDRIPLNWAMTQDNLGAALAILGQREGGVR